MWVKILHGVRNILQLMVLIVCQKEPVWNLRSNRLRSCSLMFIVLEVVL